MLLSPEGAALGVHADPVTFCTALRREIEGLSDPARLAALWARNLATLEMLQVNLPDLKTDKGEHYGAILRALFQHQLRDLKAANSERQGTEPQGSAALVPVLYLQREPASKKMLGAPEPQQAENRVVKERSHVPEPERQKDGAPQRPERNPKAAQKIKEPPLVPERSQPVNQAAKGTSHAPEPPAGPARVDKAALAIDAPRRVRDKEHLKFVRDQPCLVCGRAPSQAHHLRFAQTRALSRKVSDEWVVPLCALHHQSLHTVGDERIWWKHQGIDPVAKAERFWADTAGRL